MQLSEDKIKQTGLQLKEIRIKIEQLLKENNNLTKENKQLNKQIEKWQEVAKIQKASITDCENKIKILELSIAAINEDSVKGNKSRQLKMKLNEMIKEVESAIKFLNE